MPFYARRDYDAFTRVANRMLGPAWEIEAHRKDAQRAEISLLDAEGRLPFIWPGSSLFVLAHVISRAIFSEATTEIEFSANQIDIIYFGGYKGGAVNLPGHVIDLGDIIKVEKEKHYGFAAAILCHEIWEAYQQATTGVVDFDPHHDDAIAVENLAGERKFDEGRFRVEASKKNQIRSIWGREVRALKYTGSFFYVYEENSGDTVQYKVTYDQGILKAIQKEVLQEKTLSDVQKQANLNRKDSLLSDIRVNNKTSPVRTYTAFSGGRLGEIAHYCGVSLAVLASNNVGLKIENRQEIILSRHQHRVMRGENLNSIAQRYSRVTAQDILMDQRSLLQLSNPMSPAPGTVLSFNRRMTSSEAANTLRQLAQAGDTTVEKIAELNPKLRVQAGEVIRLPVR